MTKEKGTRDITELREMLKNSNPVDVAERFDKLNDQQAIRLFRMLPKTTAAEVFAYLTRDMQENIVNAIQDYEISHIIDELFLDDAVDFIEEMPAGVVKRVLKNLPNDKRVKINNFLKYPEGSAGSVMTIEYVDLKEHLTVAESLERIRRDGVDKETIYTCYVIDAQRQLLGVVTAKTLLLSPPDAKIGDIMIRDFISAPTTEDVEELANDFRKYGLLAMPVVDNENRLVGIITVDDVLEIQEEEATEDFEIMAAISPSDDPYLKTGVLRLARNRLPWLTILMIAAIFTGSILEYFEDAIAQILILLAFVPMLMDTCGTGGSQSATLIIRGMALEEIKTRDVLRVLWKELRVSFICGLWLAIVNFGRVVLQFGVFGSDLDVSAVTLGWSVSLALWSTVVIAKVLGCLLPIGAKKLRMDPAVMSAPLITTIGDIASLLVFFGIATVVFGL